MNRIRKGDLVISLAGKDKGKTGTVEQIVNFGKRAVVGGINLVKKHRKASAKNPKGGINSVPAPIAISSLAIICTKCQKKTRVAIKSVDGKNQRFCRKCREQL